MLEFSETPLFELLPLEMFSPLGLIPFELRFGIFDSLLGFSLEGMCGVCGTDVLGV